MPDRSLAHILYQCSKMLVSLLEQHYGFGKQQRKEYVEQVVVIKNSVDTRDFM